MIFFLLLINYTVVDIHTDARWTDPELILQVSGLKKGQNINSVDIKNAIINLNRLGLFNFIAIDTSIVGDGIFYKIIVREAPFLKNPPKFIGNIKIKDKDFNKELNIRVGQILNDRVVFDLKRKIIELYQSKSFYRTIVMDSLYIDSLNKAELFFIIDEGIEPRISRIDINGNTSFTDEKIKRLMQNKPKAFLRGGKLDEEKLDEDIIKIESFYKERGYLDVCVDDSVNVEDSAFVISINIRESGKYYIGNIAFSGNAIFDVQRLQGLLNYNGNEIYNLSKVEESYQNIIGIYADEGYIFATVKQTEDIRDSFIDIHYHIDESSPAYINRVIITGNTTTYECVIRRELTTIPGKKFRRSDIMRSLRELYNLGFFEDITPDIGTPNDSGYVDLIYRVKEKQGVATVGLGMSYSAQDNFTGYLELSHPNFLGRGQKVNTKLEAGGSLTSIELGFSEPWLFGRKTSFGSQVYYTNRQWDYYNKRDIGFIASLSLPFYLDYSRLGYSLRTEQTKVFDITDSYTAPSSGYSLYDDTIPRWTIANSFTLTRDSRDYIFNPTSGSYLVLGTEFAKKFLFAQVDYNKMTFEARVYTPLFWKFVLMARIKTGVVTSLDEVPYYKRFYAGGTGDYGVRGYSDRSLSPVEDDRLVGGDAVFINNLELKCKLSQGIALLLFYDAGNAFSDYKDINLHNLYKGTGVGMRAQIPMMGVLGFDVGYGFDKEEPGFEFHFQINPQGMF